MRGLGSRFGWICMTCLALPLIMGSCAFDDRVMLMKEYESSLPPELAPSLAGRAICIAGFTDTTEISKKWDASEGVEAPAAFEYREMESDEEERWDDDLEQIKATTSKEDYVVVGWVRNGFGMHTADVLSVNSPAEWLAQVLALELEGQGARIVPEEQAEIVISGTIRYRKVDIYMNNWADVVVDFELQPRGEARIAKSIHATGGQTAWSSSSYEFYRAFRRCQQRLVWCLIPEIESALPQPTPEPVPTS